MEQSNKDQKEKQQFQFQTQEQKEVQSAEMQHREQTAVKFEFQFESPKADGGEAKRTEISEALNAAFSKPRSRECLDILKKQVISAMSDEQIKQIIAREIVRGGATGMDEVVSLDAFMKSETESETEEISSEEQALIEEMSEEDVMEFLEALNASFAETIQQEEMQLKEALLELDKKAIDESYMLAKCPIYPEHDIHILPKHNHLFFCHLAHKPLSPVFTEAKRLLYSGEASMVHVYQGCAFVIDKMGKVTKRVDVVDEPMRLIIQNGWEELP